MAKRKNVFTTLKKIRETVRTEQYRRLAEAEEAESIIETQQQQLEEESNVLVNFKKQEGHSSDINIDKLMSVLRYESVLAVQKTVLLEQRTLLNAESQRRRAALILADQQVKTVEQLKARIEEKEQKELLRQETLSLDEASTQMYLQANRKCD